MKLQNKSKEIFLLFQIFVALIIHIFWPIILDLNVEKHKKQAMIAFNQELKSQKTSLEVLSYLKILINNYESLNNTSILNSRDVKELKMACDSLEPIQKKYFLYYSLSFNLAVIGSILVPGLSYSIKRIYK